VYILLVMVLSSLVESFVISLLWKLVLYNELNSIIIAVYYFI